VNKTVSQSVVFLLILLYWQADPIIPPQSKGISLFIVSGLYDCI